MSIKKIFSFSILVLLSFILISCNYSISRKKPTNLYYTNLLAKNLTLKNISNAVVVETNFYKEKNIPLEDLETIKAFATNLTKANFIDKPKDLPKKAVYKILLTFNKDKYVINIYSDKYISIFPWDGNYPMDYIDMENIQLSRNLYNLCKYIIEKQP